MVDYCDGWMPISVRAGDIGAGIADLRRRAETAGRDPNSLSVTVFGAKPDEAILRSYEKAGVDRALFGLPSADRETILPLLDRHAALVEQFT